jgi:hypothetical protein
MALSSPVATTVGLTPYPILHPREAAGEVPTHGERIHSAGGGDTKIPGSGKAWT